MDLVINAKPRTIFGKQNKKLRKAGMLPAVLYGRGKASLALEVSRKDFEKVYKSAGESTLVNLVVQGKDQKKVLIHDVSMHFMSQTPIHIDFYEVDLTRKIHAKIPLHFVSASPAVKELGGILVKSLNELEIEALPTDLPPFIDVGLDTLASFEDLIRVSDLPVSAKIKILNHPDDVVVSVQPPRTEEELAELEKPAAEEEKAAVEELAKEEGAEGEEEEAQGEEKKEQTKPEGEPVAEEKQQKSKEKK